MPIVNSQGGISPFPSQNAQPSAGVSSSPTHKWEGKLVVICSLLGPFFGLFVSIAAAGPFCYGLNSQLSSFAGCLRRVYVPNEQTHDKGQPKGIAFIFPGLALHCWRKTSKSYRCHRTWLSYANRRAFWFITMGDMYPTQIHLRSYRELMKFTHLLEESLLYVSRLTPKVNKVD